MVHRVYEGRALTLELRGATLRHLEKEKYEITGLAATLYVEPRGQRILVAADRGLYDNAARLLTLSGRARLETATGDVLATDALVVDLDRPPLVPPAEGKLPEASRRLRTEGPFILSRREPPMTVFGTGLDTDDKFVDMKISRDSDVSLRGLPDRDGTRQMTNLRSPGLMTIRKPNARQPCLLMEVPGACALRQSRVGEDCDCGVPPGSSTLTASRALFRAHQVPDPSDPSRSSVVISSVDAVGNVVLSGGEGETAMCERLFWDRVAERTELERGTNPIELVQEGNRVVADSVRVDHRSNTAVCSGAVRAELRRRPEDPPTTVEAETLMMSGAGPGAAADGPRTTFQADVLTLLSSRRAVLKTDQLSVEAPTILFDPASGRAVVDGPKTIEVTPKDRPKMKMTCAGTAISDRASGRVLLQRDVRIISSDFTLEADRAQVTMSGAEGSQTVHLKARGSVLVRQDAGQQVTCDHLDYESATEKMLVIGRPKASIRNAQSDLICEEATIDTKQQTLRTVRREERVRIVVPRRLGGGPPAPPAPPQPGTVIEPR